MSKPTREDPRIKILAKWLAKAARHWDWQASGFLRPCWVGKMLRELDTAKPSRKGKNSGSMK